MSRPADPRKAYLEFHGAGWRAVVFVPAAARRAVGATKLVQNLDTDSLRQANLRKKPHVERFKRRIAAALASVGQPSEDDLNLAVELSKVARDLKRNGTSEDRDEFDRAVYERHAEIRWKDARWIPAEDPEEGPTHVEQALPEQTTKAMLFSAASRPSTSSTRST